MGKSAKIRHRRRRRQERRWTPAHSERLRKTLDELLEDSIEQTFYDFISLLWKTPYCPVV